MCIYLCIPIYNQAQLSLGLTMQSGLIMWYQITCQCSLPWRGPYDKNSNINVFILFKKMYSFLGFKFMTYCHQLIPFHVNHMVQLQSSTVTSVYVICFSPFCYIYLSLHTHSKPWLCLMNYGTQLVMSCHRWSV